MSLSEQFTQMKKRNAEYIDEVTRTGSNPKENAEFIVQQENVKNQQYQNQMLYKEINKTQQYAKKLQQLNQNSKNFRSKLVEFLDSILNSKISKRMDVQLEKEVLGREECKKLVAEAK